MQDASSIVVTGSGLTTALGVGVERNWQRLLAGDKGFAPVTTFPVGDANVHDAGLAPPGDARTAAFDDGRTRSTAHLETVIREALGHREGPDGDRTALFVGSSLASSASSEGFWTGWIEDGPVDADYRALKSYDTEPMLAALCDTFGVRGEALLVANACAAGGSSVALAWEQLQSGRADTAIACGVDSLEMHTFAGFHALSLLTPEPSLRPFSKERKGMKLGDGFAALILEREDDARAAGRPILGRLLGCGESADAHSLTQPHPEGLGAALAMRRALRVAGRSADEIDYVHLHATCTPSNDGSEYAALRSVFGDRLGDVLLHASKPSFGHTLGAAGTVNAVLTVEVLRRGCIPMTDGIDAELEFQPAAFAVSGPETRRLRLGLSNAFGFGGANAALLFEGPGEAA